MNRCYELERSAADHNKGLTIKIGICSNIPDKKHYAESGRKAKPENISDGNIPIHYVRPR